MGYILTRPAALKLQSVFRYSRHFFYEDAWISGFLAEYLQIPRIHLVGHIDPDRALNLQRDWNLIEKEATSRISLEFQKFSSNNKNATFPSDVLLRNLLNESTFENYFLVNTLHLKLKSPRMISCLWEKNVTPLKEYVNRNRKTFEKGTKLMKYLAELVRPVQCSWSFSSGNRSFTFFFIPFFVLFVHYSNLLWIWTLSTGLLQDLFVFIHFLFVMNILIQIV